MKYTNGRNVILYKDKYLKFINNNLMGFVGNFYLGMSSKFNIKF